MRYSVVISNYNGADYIAYAIGSVLASLRDDLEVVVVDDGSTDTSREVIRRFTDSRVKPVFQDNRGQAGAFNHGIAESRGKFICLLDGDDFFFPDKIDLVDEAILDLGLEDEPFIIRHPLVRVGAVGAQRTWAGTEGFSYFDRRLVSPRPGDRLHLSSPDHVLRYLKIHGYPEFIGGNSTVLSRSTADLIFPLPEHLSKFYGDLFPVLAAPIVGQAYFLGSAYAAYRFHTSNHSSIRKCYYSEDFLAGVANYLNGILKKVGQPECVDPMRARIGARYLCQRGESASAVRYAVGRLQDDLNLTNSGVLAKTIALATASALRWVSPLGKAPRS